MPLHGLTKLTTDKILEQTVNAARLKSGKRNLGERARIRVEENQGWREGQCWLARILGSVIYLFICYILM